MISRSAKSRSVGRWSIKRDFGAERGEKGSVLETDDSSTDDDEFARETVHLGDAVGVHDAFIVKRDFRIACGTGATGDENVFAVENRLIGVALHFDGMRIGELRGALENLYPIPAKLRADDFRFATDDAVDAKGKILDGDIVFAAVIFAVKGSHGVTGELKDGFAHAFARNRAGMHADAADHEGAVHDGDALAELCGADCAFLAGGSATNYDEVEIEISHAFTRYFDGFYLKLKQRAGGTATKWCEYRLRVQKPIAIPVAAREGESSASTG